MENNRQNLTCSVVQRCSQEPQTINHLKLLENEMFIPVTLNSDEKSTCMMTKWQRFKRGKQTRTQMFPSRMNIFLYSSARGRLLIVSVWLWVCGVALKILPSPLLELHCISFIPLNLTAIICIGIAIRWSIMCLSRQIQSKSFEPEGCILVRDDLFMTQRTQQEMISYLRGPPFWQGQSKGMLNSGTGRHVLPKAFVP